MAVISQELAAHHRAEYVDFVAEHRGMKEEFRMLEIGGTQEKVFGNECFQTLMQVRNHHLRELKKNFTPRLGKDVPTEHSDRVKMALIDLMDAQLDYLARIGLGELPKAA